MSDIEVLHPNHPKVYARWTVIIGGGKSPIKWAKKPPTTPKSTAKLSHIAKVIQGRLEPALASGERQSFKRTSPINAHPWFLDLDDVVLKAVRPVHSPS